jgi:hypothetical protein
MPGPGFATLVTRVLILRQQANWQKLTLTGADGRRGTQAVAASRAGGCGCKALLLGRGPPRAWREPMVVTALSAKDQLPNLAGRVCGAPLWSYHSWTGFE